MNFSQHQTEASVIADLMKPSIQTIRGLPFSLVPGEHPKLIDAALTPPPFIAQNVVLASLEAMKAFCEFHGYEDADEQGPVIFASQKSLSFTLIFDYHLSCMTPAHSANRALVALAKDPRFVRWERMFNQWMDQEAFVDLLTENEAALHTPPAAEMLTLAENLEIHQNCKVVNRRSARNGTGEIRFETSEGEGSTKVPEFITIGVPIYEGLRTDKGPKAWLIQLRLRYRVKNGLVEFQLVPVKLEDILEGIWRDLLDEVRKIGPEVIEGVAPALPRGAAE